MSGEMSCGGGIYNSISVTRPNHHEGQGTQMQPGCCAGFLFISDSLTLSFLVFSFSLPCFYFLSFFSLLFLIFFPCLFSSLLSFAAFCFYAFSLTFFFPLSCFSPLFLALFLDPYSMLSLFMLHIWTVYCLVCKHVKPFGGGFLPV